MRTMHGYSKTRVYRIWQLMRSRCSNPNTPTYKHYGGRGICVCDRWQHFPNFLADMGEPPDKYTLERIDNAGNYEPSNVRWATRQEQANNTRRNLPCVYNGKRFASVAQLAAYVNKPEYVLWRRISRGWSVEDAVTWSIGRQFKRHTSFKPVCRRGHSKPPGRCPICRTAYMQEFGKRRIR